MSSPPPGFSVNSGPPAGFTIDEKPKKKEAPKTPEFSVGNTALLVAERAAHLTGGLIGGLHTVIDEGLEQLGVPEDIRGGKVSEALAASLKSVDLGGEHSASPDTIVNAWENGDLSDVATEVLTFATESGIESVPDMIAAMLTLPTYVAARAGEMMNTRAENKGLEEPTAREYFEALPFAMGSAILERAGAKGIVDVGDAVTIGKSALQRGITSAAKQGGKGLAREATTEFFQEGVIEYIGETFGTEAETNWREGLERGAWASLAGGVYGGIAGAARGATSADYRHVDTDDFVDLKTGEPTKMEPTVYDKGMSADLLGKIQREVVTADGSIPNEGIIGTIGKHLIYKPTEVLRDWNSPTLTNLADSIFRPTRADKSTNFEGIDFVDSLSQAQGHYNKTFHDMMGPYRARFRSIEKGADKAIVQGLRTGKVKSTYREIASDVREFLDNFHREYISPVLPDVKFEPDYFPQIWNISKLLRRPEAAIRAFQKLKLIEEVKDENGNVTRKLIDIDRQTAEGIVRRIVENEGSYDMDMNSDRLMDAADASRWSGRIKNTGGATQTMHEQSRKIYIPDEVLGEAELFLENNLQAVMDSYIRNTTKRVEYARTFGANEEILNSAVASAIDEAGIANNPAAVTSLTKSVYGLADALQNKYKPIEDLSWAKWNRRIANYETVLHLGLVALASFPELAAPAIQFGFVPTSYAKGVAHAILEATASAERVLLGGDRRTPKLKAAEALESMGAISLNTIQSTQASRYTSVSSQFTSKFMHATGLELLTDVQKVIAYDTLTKIIERNSKALAKGKSGRKAQEYKSQLMELGISPEKAVEWAKTGAHEDVIELAKLRGQRWAVTQPTPASRPLLFSDPHFTNVLLFKSFTGVFSNVFMKRAMGDLGLIKGKKGALLERRAGIVGAMAASVAIAYYTQFLREMISGQNVEMEDMERIVAAFDRAALLGPLTHVYNLINPYRYGYSDNGAKRLLNMAGPAGGTLANIIDIVHPETSPKERRKKIAKQIPVIKISKDVREEVEDALP